MANRPHNVSIKPYYVFYNDVIEFSTKLKMVLLYAIQLLLELLPIILLGNSVILAQRSADEKLTIQGITAFERDSSRRLNLQVEVIFPH